MLNDSPCEIFYILTKYRYELWFILFLYENTWNRQSFEDHWKRTFLTRGVRSGFVHFTELIFHVSVRSFRRSLLNEAVCIRYAWCRHV